MRRGRRDMSPPAFRRTVATLAVAALHATAAPAASPPGPGSPEAWLDGVERRLVGLSGLPFEVRGPSGARTGRFVFYAPLATIWRLSGSGPEVSRAGRVRAIVTDRGHFAAVFWGRGEIASLAWPDALPDIVPSGDAAHPLAEFHDRLLSLPLGSPLGDLPAGSRFVPVVASGPGGIVERPDTPGRVTIWESLGDRIAVTHPDGARTVHAWREVDAALEGGAE
ncbi:MAG: hypothetical protein F4213_18845 [Boseongicola sp. SB0677_bin_26]|nr:hypothetical protein [Boseongicola sp. SB0665_bin_10]MYG28049.1 hypothetical protein [Boseongicola sp. SB0677_bin_26]